MYSYGTVSAPENLLVTYGMAFKIAKLEMIHIQFNHKWNP